MHFPLSQRAVSARIRETQQDCRMAICLNVSLLQPRLEKQDYINIITNLRNMIFFWIFQFIFL